MPPETGSDLWTVADCAAYLRRSPRWVWSHLQQSDTQPGSIPHLRLPGGSPRFMPEVVRQWLEDGCPPAASLRKLRKK